jgi:RNA-dependent RNA polymerase
MFERICHVAECEPRPIRVPRIDARAMGFFSHRDIVKVQRWIKTMDWKNAFQIEAYLRSGLLTTHDLLQTLQKPIEQAIHYYGNEASEFLRLFSVELKMRKPDEEVQTALHACAPNMSISTHFGLHQDIFLVIM